MGEIEMAAKAVQDVKAIEAELAQSREKARAQIVEDIGNLTARLKELGYEYRLTEANGKKKQ